MKLLDTNVVIYAIGGPHPLKEACQRLFQDIAGGNAAYVIDVELLQEVLYIYSSRGQRHQALQVFDLLLRIFPDPLSVGRAEVTAARDILQRHASLSPRDAIHLGVALTQGLEGVVTTDEGIFRAGEAPCFQPGNLYPG